MLRDSSGKYSTCNKGTVMNLPIIYVANHPTNFTGKNAGKLQNFEVKINFFLLNYSIGHFQVKTKTSENKICLARLDPQMHYREKLIVLRI